jgi:hypothetical protein
MSKSYKTGDRVKVTIEGVVQRTIKGDYLIVNNEAGKFLAELSADGRDGITVEETVVRFQPGDVVRARDNDHYHFLVLRDNQYTYVKSLATLDIGQVVDSVEPFTSEEYEKVELHESPL